MRAPSKTPSVPHQFVWGSLLLPEPLLGLTTELQRDLWPVFGFSSNIPSHSGHGVAAVPLPTSGATGLEGRAAQNSLQMEDERAALMDVSGAARPYSSPTDPCRAGCSKCCPAREKWHHGPSLSPTLPAWSKRDQRPARKLQGIAGSRGRLGLPRYGQLAGQASCACYQHLNGSTTWAAGNQLSSQHSDE